MGKRMNPGGGIEKRCAAAAVLALALVTVPAAFTQDSESVNVDVGECVNLESAEARFACYEARVEAARPATEPPKAAAAEPRSSDLRPSAEPPRSSEPKRSAEPPQRAATEPRTVAQRRADARDEADEAVEIFGTIASLRETVPNSYLITLEDGQVWRQMRPKWYPMRPGQKVRIYPGRLGTAYRLTAGNLNSFVQVERVR
jgi:hypothetical protein